MARMEIILTANVPGLGAESDKVVVAAGYARNYLIPQRLAIPVNEANEKRLEALRKRRQQREAHEFKTMKELADSFRKAFLRILVKTGEGGRMFGSVTPAMIAAELKQQWDVDLDHRKIHMEEPIRKLGEHEVELRLHPKVRGTLKIQVESSTPVEEPSAAEEASGAAQPPAS
ncbi:MAG: 50S ribosomal protein L9 [Verrucomicrobia bacterium]|nr:50S ribosomal protein L9 [Verrucomicrobiota bacterium]